MDGKGELRSRRAEERRASFIPHSQPSPSSYWGLQQDAAQWHAVYELYASDKVQGAWELAQTLSVGLNGQQLSFVRVLEAEAQTREASVTHDVSDWLSVEYVPDEIEGEEEVKNLAIQACESVAERLTWSHEVPTLLTVLSHNADAGFRLGYETPKYPYEKLVIAPITLADGTFSSVVEHEYAHVISENMADSALPTWVTEGVSIWAANQLEPSAPFRNGTLKWLPPEELETTFARTWAPIRRELPARWAAYQQSGLIIQWLAETFGDAKISDFLRAHASQSIWSRISWQRPTTRALRSTYRLSEEEVFKRTLASLSAKQKGLPSV